MRERPSTTVILAMTADGKISDRTSSPARFGSQRDKEHLEAQIALVDGVIFGATTLRAYGTTLSIQNSELLAQRQQRNQPPQPVHIVCSASGKLDSQWRFFSQPVPRWLLTTDTGANHWQQQQSSGFEKVIRAEMEGEAIAWPATLGQLGEFGLKKLAILGGGTLVSSLLTADCIDEIWLTICPFLVGGKLAPTPVEGEGFLLTQAKALQLLSVKQQEQEIFLHYRVEH
ncbi:MAG: RibD family protein [Snowella sp.]|nr:RibD family protein [Snowella sp.]